MKVDVSTLPDGTQLKQMLVDFQGHFDKETGMLLEQVRHLSVQLFDCKSEKVRPESTVEPFSLFDMPEPEFREGAEVVHDIDDAEKVCGCGCEFSRIGEEVSKQLDIIPTQVQVIRHIRPKYARKNCEGVKDDGPTIKIVPVPSLIILKSIAGLGLLAHILTGKVIVFCCVLLCIEPHRASI